MIEHHKRTPAGFFDLARTYRPSHDDIRGAWDQYLRAPATPETSFAVPGAATDLRGLPPALVLTAAQDPLRVEAEAYADRMAEAGIAVQCRCFAEVGHSFLGEPPGTAGVDAALAEIQVWVTGLVRTASVG
jgi:acetyl esterase/lipase